MTTRRGPFGRVETGEATLELVESDAPETEPETG